jgi:hypothetical protein
MKILKIFDSDIEANCVRIVDLLAVDIYKSKLKNFDLHRFAYTYVVNPIVR